MFCSDIVKVSCVYSYLLQTSRSKWGSSCPLLPKLITSFAFSVTTLQNWSWGQSFSVSWASVLWIPWGARRESRIKERKLSHCHTHVLATWALFWSAQLLFLKSCNEKETTFIFPPFSFCLSLTLSILCLSTIYNFG